MKILLVAPVYNYKYAYPIFVSIINFPVGFAYLASSLKTAGFEVFGLNPNNKPGYPNAFQMLQDQLSTALKTIEPDLIGVGGLCTDYHFIKDAISIIREKSPKVPIVLGGGIVNNDAEFAFQTLKPDFCIVGEAEEAIVQLAEAIKSSQKMVDHIPSLGYWNNGIAQFTKPGTPNPDLNKLPFPDYEPFGVEEMLDHLSLAAGHPFMYPRLNPRQMTLVAARSCPFSCTFCVHQRGAKYRARSIENILKEIAFLYEKYHFNILFLSDELFAANKSRLRDFSEAILKAKKEKGWDFHWSFQTHASASFDRETLALAKKAGLYFFSYGLESASPRVLVSMNKKTHPSQYLEAIKLVNELKIGFGGNFIFGDLVENGETITETMSFFRQYCEHLTVSLGYIQPYPGSKIFDYCLEKGLIKDKFTYYENIDKMPFQINMTTMPFPLWYLWLMAFKYYNLISPWYKSVEAKSCHKIPSKPGNPMVSGTSSLYEIVGNCPFCETEARIRNILDLENDSLATGTLLAQAKSFVKGNRFVYFLSIWGIKFLSLWRPLHNLFSHFKFKKDFAVRTSVITGCTNCHKRFKINV